MNTDLAALTAARNARRAQIIADMHLDPAVHMIAARPVKGVVVSTVHTQGCGCKGYAGTIGRPINAVHPDELTRATRATCAA